MFCVIETPLIRRATYQETHAAAAATAGRLNITALVATEVYNEII